MAIRIGLFTIIGIILARIVGGYDKRTKGKYTDKIIIVLIISVISVAIFLIAIPVNHGENNFIGNSKYIYSFSNIGSLYYNENLNEYFILRMKLWDPIHLWDKIIIDNDIGTEIHYTKNVIESATDYINTLIK